MLAHAASDSEVAEASGGPALPVLPTVAAIAVVNLALKLPHLGRQSLWLDEALTVTAAGRSFAEIVAHATVNQNPPLYGFLMHVWLGAFGISETSARLFPVLSSTATAVLLFLLALRFLGARAAVLAVLLFTLMNVQVQYAREARVYALVELLATASSYAFLALVTRPRWRTAVVLAVLNALLFFSHYVTVFLPLAQLVATVAHRPWRLRAGRHVLAAAGASAVLVLPWLPYAWRNAPTAGAYWLEPPTWRDLRHVLKRFADKNRLLYATLLLLVPAVRRALRVPRGAFDGGVGQYLVLWGLLPLALAFVIAARIPIFLDRYLLYASLGLVLTFAYLLAVLPLSRRAHAVVAAGLVALLAPSTLREAPKDDWRALAARAHELRAMHSPATALVLVAAHEVPPFAYYFDRASFAAPGRERTLRERGVVAVAPGAALDAATLAGVAAVAIVRPRLGAPEVAGLDGFGAPRAWARVQGLDLLVRDRSP